MTTTPSEIERPPQVFSWRFAALVVLAVHTAVVIMMTCADTLELSLGSKAVGWSRFPILIGATLWIDYHRWTVLVVALVADVVAIVALVRLWTWKGRRLVALYCSLAVIITAMLIVPYCVLVRLGTFEVPDPHGVFMYNLRYEVDNLAANVAIAVLLMVPALILLAAYLRQRRAFKRVRRNLCGFCAFDLRATTGGRCTECGRSNSEILLPEVARRSLSASPSPPTPHP